MHAGESCKDRSHVVGESTDQVPDERNERRLEDSLLNVRGNYFSSPKRILKTMFA